MVWWWLLAGLGLVAVLACMLLASVPLTLRFTVDSSPKWRSRVELKWFGRRWLPRDPHAPRPTPKPERRRAEPEQRRRRRRSRRGAPRLSAVVRDALPYLARFSWRLVAQTRIDELVVDCRAGLGDPADTGMLCGLLAPPLAALSGLRRCALRFQPELIEECLELHGHGQVTIVPLRYAFVVCAFLLTPRTWRLGFELARA